MESSYRTAIFGVAIILYSSVFSGCAEQPSAETGRAEGKGENALLSNETTASNEPSPTSSNQNPSGKQANSQPESPESPDTISPSGKEQQAEVSLQVIDPQEFPEVLKDYRGQVVLVDFWATWCIPCVKQFPHTVEMHRKYGQEGLGVISVSLDDADKETRQRVLDFLKEKNARFQNLLSSEGISQQSVEAFEIDNGALPHYKIFDRQGKLVRKFSSGDPEASFTHEEIEQAVIETLAQKPNSQ